MSGFAAVPGALLPGAATPGQVITGSAPPPPPSAWTFLGPEELVYPTYIDVQESHTLAATPGSTYRLAPPPGTGQPDVPDDGLWTPAS